MITYHELREISPQKARELIRKVLAKQGGDEQDSPDANISDRQYVGQGWSFGRPEQETVAFTGKDSKPL
jgi:hypothetical protein